MPGWGERLYLHHYIPPSSSQASVWFAQSIQEALREMNRVRILQTGVGDRIRVTAEEGSVTTRKAALLEFPLWCSGLVIWLVSVEALVLSVAERIWCCCPWPRNFHTPGADQKEEGEKKKKKKAGLAPRRASYKARRRELIHGVPTVCQAIFWSLPSVHREFISGRALPLQWGRSRHWVWVWFSAY